MQTIRQIDGAVEKFSDDDQFVLSPRAALYVAFLDVGHSSDEATLLAEYSMAHPDKLLEDCKPSVARAWAASPTITQPGE